LAGILIESSSTGVFIGVGVNVFQRGEQDVEEHSGEQRPPAALSLLAPVELPRVATSVLAAVLEGVGRFFSEGLAGVHQLWPTHALHSGGGRVRLEDGVTGEVVGLSDEGGLLVQTPAETGGEIKTVFAGDVFYFL
jgi:biotin-(acetyl-CoA carboxylase) ligase